MLGAGYAALMFDPATMKDDRDEDDEMDLNELRQQYVELALTPALFKRGTSKGERFDSEYCAVRAKVWLMTSR